MNGFSYAGLSLYITDFYPFQRLTVATLLQASKIWQMVECLNKCCLNQDVINNSHLFSSRLRISITFIFEVVIIPPDKTIYYNLHITIRLNDSRLFFISLPLLYRKQSGFSLCIISINELVCSGVSFVIAFVLLTITKSLNLLISTGLDNRTILSMRANH